MDREKDILFLEQKVAGLKQQLAAANKAYEQYTTGEGLQYHNIWCSADRRQPMGCPGCSCTIGHKLKSQQAEIERLCGERESQVLHPLGSDCKPTRTHTYCCRCGTGVRDQKYCHGCGRKLLWADIEKNTVAVYERLEQEQKGGSK